MSAGKIFVGLHNHSMFSLKDSISRPDDMARKAKELGMSSLAISDHGTLASWLMFQEACKKHGIKPIFGVEAYFVDDIDAIKRMNIQSDELKAQIKVLEKEDLRIASSGSTEPMHKKKIETMKAKSEEIDAIKKSLRKYNHLILLAKNWNGCLALIRMHNRATIDGMYYKPRLDWKILEEEVTQGDIVASSACLGGRIAKCIEFGQGDAAIDAINRYNSIFGKGNFYLELQLNHEGLQKNLNIELINLSEATGTPTIVTCDSHYVEQGTHETRALFRRLDIEGDSAYDDTAMVDLFIKNEDQLFIAWKKYMGGLPATHLAKAIKNTREIADSIQNFPFDTSLKFPTFVTDSDDNQEDFLTKTAIKGLMAKNLHKDKRYTDRLKRELKTINKLGFAGYFNIVGDLVNTARHNQAVGPGRGSAAGSLVAFCVGITNVDPIKFELYFERFLDESKGIQMPTFGLEIAEISLDYDAILEACRCHKTR